ncbi:unnamed protein product, partial [marine sediment metagenome]
MLFFEDIIRYIKFSRGFKKFMKEEFSYEKAVEIVKKGLQNREENFLKTIREIVFDNKRSPYLKLLKFSKFEYKDIEKFVSRNGIEETLRRLRQEGVYLTVEEFKGRIPVIRGGQTFRFKERDFDNPALLGSFKIR